MLINRNTRYVGLITHEVWLSVLVVSLPSNVAHEASKDDVLSLDRPSK